MNCAKCDRPIVVGKDFQTSRTIILEEAKGAYREFGVDLEGPTDIDQMLVDAITDETIFVKHEPFCQKKTEAPAK